MSSQVVSKVNTSNSNAEFFAAIENLSPQEIADTMSFYAKDGQPEIALKIWNTMSSRHECIELIVAVHRLGMGALIVGMVNSSDGESIITKSEDSVSTEGKLAVGSLMGTGICVDSDPGKNAVTVLDAGKLYTVLNCELKNKMQLNDNNDRYYSSREGNEVEEDE